MPASDGRPASRALARAPSILEIDLDAIVGELARACRAHRWARALRRGGQGRCLWAGRGAGSARARRGRVPAFLRRNARRRTGAAPPPAAGRDRGAERPGAGAPRPSSGGRGCCRCSTISARSPRWRRSARRRRRHAAHRYRHGAARPAAGRARPPLPPSPSGFEGVALAGILSHLACAGEPDDPLNEAQRQAFAAALARLPRAPASLAASSRPLPRAALSFRFRPAGSRALRREPASGPPQSDAASRSISKAESFRCASN